VSAEKVGGVPYSKSCKTDQGMRVEVQRPSHSMNIGGHLYIPLHYVCFQMAGLLITTVGVSIVQKHDNVTFIKQL
jgi:hypothetical protein